MKRAIVELVTRIQLNARANNPTITIGVDLESANTAKRLKETLSLIFSCNDWKSLAQFTSNLSAVPTEAARGAGARAMAAISESRQKEKNREIYQALRASRVIEQLHQAIRYATTYYDGKSTERKIFPESLLLAWAFINEYENSPEHITENGSSSTPDCIKFMITHHKPQSLSFLLLHSPATLREKVAQELDKEENIPIRRLAIANAFINCHIAALHYFIDRENFNSPIPDVSSAGYSHPLKIAKDMGNPHSIAWLVEIANGLTDPAAIEDAKRVTTQIFGEVVDNLEIALALLESRNIDLLGCFEHALVAGNTELAQKVLEKCPQPLNPELLQTAITHSNPLLVEQLFEAGIKPVPEYFRIALHSTNRDSAATLTLLLQAGKDDPDFNPEERAELVYQLLHETLALNNDQSLGQAEKLLEAVKKAGVQVEVERFSQTIKSTSLGKKNALKLTSIAITTEKQIQRSLEVGDPATIAAIAAPSLKINISAFLHAALTANPRVGKNTDEVFWNILQTIQFSDGNEDPHSLTKDLDKPHKGWPALHYAISQRIPKATIETLLEIYGANPNLKNLSGQNALQIALKVALDDAPDGITSPNLNTVEALLTKSPVAIDCNNKDANGRTSFYQLMRIWAHSLAAGEENTTAKELAEIAFARHGASYDAAFEVAMREKDGVTASHILNITKDLDPPHPMDKMLRAAFDQDDAIIAESILTHASALGQDLLSRMSLNSGPNPTHLAAERDNPAMLSLLLRHGSNSNSSNANNGETLLTATLRKYATNPNFKLVSLQLLAMGANPFAANDQGISPLHLTLTTAPENEIIDIATGIITRAGSYDIDLGRYCIRTIDRIIEDKSLTSEQRTRSLLRLNDVIAKDHPHLLPTLAARYVCSTDHRAALQNPAALVDDVLNKMTAEQKGAFLSDTTCSSPFSFTEAGGRIIEIDSSPKRPGLHHAVEKRDTDLMRILVRHGANPTISNNRRESTLAFAARCFADAPVHYLLTSCPNPTDEAALLTPPGLLISTIDNYLLFEANPSSLPTLYTLAAHPKVRGEIPQYYSTIFDQDPVEEERLQTLNQILLDGIAPNYERDKSLGQCFQQCAKRKRFDLALPLLEAIDDDEIKRKTIIQSFCIASLNMDEESCRTLIVASDAKTRETLIPDAWQYPRTSGSNQDQINRVHNLLSGLAAEMDDIPLPLTRAKKMQLALAQEAAAAAAATAAEIPLPTPTFPVGLMAAAGIAAGAARG